MTPVEINRTLQNIQEEIQTVVLQARVESEGRNILKTFTAQIAKLFEGPYKDIKRIRLRSSTNSEDLPQFNGAGLYESAGYSRNKSEGVLLNNLGKVLSSLWLPRAYWEREFFGIDQSNVAISIQINPAHKEEVANGVVIYGLENEAEVWWINAQLGSASVTNPENDKLPESFWVGADWTSPRVQSQSGLGPVFLKGREIGRDRSEQLKILLNSSQKIGKNMLEEQSKKDSENEYSVDLEFKLVPGKDGAGARVIIKQARLLYKGKKKKN
jgi:hypothetical protein